MRTVLSSLTTRGRSFLAAGVTAVICAYALGERDLLRVGVLILALPLLSLLVVARTRYRLTCARRVTPPRLPMGHEAQVDLLLENVSRLPTGILLLEDHAPYALDARTRFVVDRIEPNGGREMSYRVRSDVRGRHRLGPLTVRLADPFGLVELGRSFTRMDKVTVTPPIVTLPHARLAGSWAAGGESRARTVSTAGEDDVAPREYRHGDDLRRVHWRSTARHGRLMVRREEQQWHGRGTLFLDTRRYAHRGTGAGSSFEQAVSAAASIGVQLSRAGLGLRFVTDTGEGPAPSVGFEGALLDTLAVIGTSARRSLYEGLAALRGISPSGDGLLVGVFGTLSAEDARALANARTGASTGIAVLMDPAAWTTDPTVVTEAESSAALLRIAGWRVVTVASAADLATAWPHADRPIEGNRLPAGPSGTADGGL